MSSQLFLKEYLGDDGFNFQSTGKVLLKSFLAKGFLVLNDVVAAGVASSTVTGENLNQRQNRKTFKCCLVVLTKGTLTVAPLSRSAAKTGETAMAPAMIAAVN